MPDQISLPISFKPMTAESAERLGVAFAAIDPWAHYRETPEQLTAYLARKEDGALRYEILVGETLAGAICIRKNWLCGPYVQFLAVVPQFQKQGIGGHALSWFEENARQDNVRNIWIVATGLNVGALALYERFGFIRVATLDGLVTEGTDEILLRKRLTVS
jgi:ribosomal protein S18 acetylase RimI-like enzyme